MMAAGLTVIEALFEKEFSVAVTCTETDAETPFVITVKAFELLPAGTTTEDATWSALGFEELSATVTFPWAETPIRATWPLVRFPPTILVLDRVRDDKTLAAVWTVTLMALYAGV